VQTISRCLPSPRSDGTASACASSSSRTSKLRPTTLVHASRLARDVSNWLIENADRSALK